MTWTCLLCQQSRGPLHRIFLLEFFGFSLKQWKQNNLPNTVWILDSHNVLHCSYGIPGRKCILSRSFEDKNRYLKHLVMLCLAYSCIHGCDYQVSFLVWSCGMQRSFPEAAYQKKLIVLKKALVLKLLKWILNTKLGWNRISLSEFQHIGWNCLKIYLHLCKMYLILLYFCKEYPRQRWLLPWS